MAHAINNVLRSSYQINIADFRSFLTKSCSVCTDRNRQTAKVTQIKASGVTKLKVGKNLNEAVQEA